MSTSDEVKLPPPPAATAGAETAALNAQILKAGNAEDDRVVELKEEPTNDAAKAKDIPQAGLKNYFVSCAHIRVVVD